MAFGYDIFRQLGDGSPLWIAYEKSLGDATARIELLRQSTPGDYFLRDAGSGAVLYKDPSGPGRRPEAADATSTE